MRLQIVLAALTGALETDMKRAQSIVERRSKAMEKQAYETGRRIGAGLRDNIVGALSGVAIGAAFRNAVQQADQLGEIAERAGLSADELSRMGYAAKLSGIELEQFANANRALSLRLEENEELLAKLGIETIDQVTGNLRSSTDIIRDLGDAFAGMPDGIEKANIASDLFGSKLGTQMIPLLNRGTEGIIAMEKEADALGVTIGQETADQAGKLNDQLDRLGGVMNNLILTALPTLNTLLSAAGKGFLLFQGAIQKVATVAASFVTILFELDKSIGEPLRKILTFGGALSDVFELGPIDAAKKWGSEIEAVLAGVAQGSRQVVMEAVNLNAELANIDNKTADALLAFDGSGQTTRRITGIPDLEDEGGDSDSPSARSSRIRQTKEEEEADRRLAGAKQAIADSIRAADEARKQAKAAREEELAYGAQVVDDLKFELELMKMTNAEQATAIQLRGLSADAVAKYGDEIAALNEQIEANMKVTEQMDGLRQATSNLFEDLISGTVSAKDAFRSFVDDILANITRMIANNFAESLFGGMGQMGGGAFGNFASSLFGGLFGGRAGGGPVSGGMPYIVGENGPEVFIPHAPGRIANNAEVRRGMGGSQTINISVEGQMDMRSRQQLAADVGRASQKSLARSY